VDKEGVLYVVDYKATAKDVAVTELTTAPYHDTYRRQMEFYQWLLEQNGFVIDKITSQVNEDNLYFVRKT
jgi:ATP-dependent exoDNAse (exonuclease V) beta subunit